MKFCLVVLTNSTPCNCALSYAIVSRIRRKFIRFKQSTMRSQKQLLNIVQDSILSVRSMATICGIPYPNTPLAKIAKGDTVSCGEYSNVLRDVLHERGIDSASTEQLYFINNSFETHLITTVSSEGAELIADATFGLIPRIDGAWASPSAIQKIVRDQSWNRLELRPLAFYEQVLRNYYIDYALLYRGVQQPDGNSIFVGETMDYLEEVHYPLVVKRPVALFSKEKPKETEKLPPFTRIESGYLSKVFFPTAVISDAIEAGMHLYAPRWVTTSWLPSC